MLTKIGLTNFKCYRGSHEFPLSQFNLLTGINGQGKSTLLQSLLLMKQTTDHDKNANYLVLNGSCVQLGTFEDIKNSFSSNVEGVVVSFTTPNDSYFSSYKVGNFQGNKTIVYELSSDLQDEHVGLISEYQIIENDIKGLERIEKNYLIENGEYMLYQFGESVLEDKKSKGAKFLDWYCFVDLIPTESQVLENRPIHFSMSFNRIQFISADRIGPKNYYEIQNINRDFSWVGAKGENTASILLKKKDDKVHDGLYLGKDANTLLQQTEEWLNFVFDGAKININTEGGVVLISYNTKQGRERYKPANVGFGYSYILPIIVAGLIAEKGEILIIENPEAHLHPRAQHKLTQFLAKIAVAGVQIFVESHSEHILNALRICLLQQEQQAKILNNTDVSILYFQNNDEQPFVSIPLDEKGNIEEWPEGFFDQTDKDFKILFGF